MRSSISAQSLASVPPSRALMVSSAELPSSGPLNSDLISRSSSSVSRRSVAVGTSAASCASSSPISIMVARSSASVAASSSGLSSALRPFSWMTISWAVPDCSRNRPRPFAARFSRLQPFCRQSQRESLSCTIRFWMLSARSIHSRSMVALWTFCARRNLFRATFYFIGLGQQGKDWLRRTVSERLLKLSVQVPSPKGRGES